MATDRSVLVLDDDEAAREPWFGRLTDDSEAATVPIVSVHKAEKAEAEPAEQAQLGTFPSVGHASLAIGPYIFRPTAKLLDEPGKNLRIYLTEKEAAILSFLHRARNRRVPRQVLQNEVWGCNASLAPHTLVTHIHHLRQKIEAEPGNARLLITEDGGYRLDPDGSRTWGTPVSPCA